VPILGINFGHLGFLANPHDEGVVATLAAALSDETTRDERSNLRIDVLCEGDDEEAFDAMCNEPADFENGRTFFALNEASISRGTQGRVIDFSMEMNGAPVADMRGDGVLVASATGSTAYALSAGGPLVAPGFSGLIVVPVAPHTLHSRAVVTDPNDVVEIVMGDTPAAQEAIMLADGSMASFDTPIRRVRVSRGSAPTVLLRYHAEGFYAHSSRVFF
jgi:NAD+ kinase